jgi:hypothetical protein
VLWDGEGDSGEGKSVEVDTTVGFLVKSGLFPGLLPCCDGQMGGVSPRRKVVGRGRGLGSGPGAGRCVKS